MCKLNCFYTSKQVEPTYNFLKQKILKKMIQSESKKQNLFRRARFVITTTNSIIFVWETVKWCCEVAEMELHVGIFKGLSDVFLTDISLKRKQIATKISFYFLRQFQYFSHDQLSTAVRICSQILVTKRNYMQAITHGKFQRHILVKRENSTFKKCNMNKNFFQLC